MEIREPMAGPVNVLAPRLGEVLGKVDDATLIKLVLEAVHEFDITAPANRSGGTVRFNPSQTATLLAYCYARGIFSSEEIETRLPVDPAISYICAGSKPDWFLLRRFRRDNVLLILGILTRVLELVSNEFGILRTPIVPERWRNEFREQALDRLREAIHADTMAMDE